MIKLDRVKQNYTENNNVQTSFDQIGRNWVTIWSKSLGSVV